MQALLAGDERFSCGLQTGAAVEKGNQSSNFQRISSVNTEPTFNNLRNESGCSNSL
jgi:hypothetical protein